MPDIRIVNSGDELSFSPALDWLIRPDGQLDDSQALVTAVLVALGTDRHAEADDALPDPDSDDRRGWWGDLDAQDIWDGWPIGSRLWLLERAKITGGTARDGSLLARTEEYVREALYPFIDRRIASAVDVTVARTDLNAVAVTVTLRRGPLPAIEMRFNDFWSELSA
ncbi:MAG: phage GP46 family protein [Pseudolabrys sp.]